MENKAFTKKSATSLLGEDTANLLIQFGGQMSDDEWKVGDIAKHSVDDIDDVSPSVIDAAIAVLSGLSAATVADKRSVSEFYPPVVRQQYFVCSWSHFKTAKSAKTLDAAEKWLLKCIESMDEYGGVVMPVDKLRVLMQEAGSNEDTLLWEKRLRVIQNNIEKMLNEEEAPEEVMNVLMEMGVKLSAAQEAAEKRLSI